MRILLCVAVLAFASTASGASLSVSSDKYTYLYGETVTLTIIGDPGGATSYGIQGRLDYSGAQVDNGTRSQITLTGPYGKWVAGALYANDDGVNAYSFAFNQTSSIEQTSTNLPGVLSTVTLIATGLGLVQVNWHTALDGEQLDFFGLTNAPGTTFCIPGDGDPCALIPEPGTAGLLGLGLVALAAARKEGGYR